MLMSLLAQRSFWLPEVASEAADSHDVTFYAILWTTTFFFLLVVGLMLFFIVKYRRRPQAETEAAPTHNTPLEIAWTLIPLIIVIVFFVMGFVGYMDFEFAPADSETIEVTGQKWSFNFTYPNGGSSNELFVQEGRPVRLLMRSADVTHALYIPAMRVQRNIVPGRTIEMWFKPTKAGVYDVFCTQYCGDGHSAMVTKVHVLDAAGYAARLSQLANPFKGPNDEILAYHEVGKKLATPCLQCHAVEPGSPVNTGPSWLTTWRQTHTFADGSTLAADAPEEQWEAYVKESIINPGAKLRTGYSNVMPPYASQYSGTPMKEAKLKALVEYIKSLGVTDYKPVYPDFIEGGEPAAGAATQTTQPASGAVVPNAGN